MKAKKNPKFLIPTEEEEFFLECILMRGKSQTEAYIDMLEVFDYEDFKAVNKNSSCIRSRACKLSNKLKQVIKERRQEAYYTKEDKRLTLMEEVLEKKQNLQQTPQVGEVAFSEEATQDVIEIAKNPMLVNTAFLTGTLTLLFDRLEVKKNKAGKFELASAIPNATNWIRHADLVKEFVGKNILQKDMFKYASEKNKAQAPTSATQVNVNVNK